MAEFTQLTITEKGRKALADAFVNGTLIDFTKIAASSKGYAPEQLEEIEDIENVVQENLISGKNVKEDNIILETAFTNTELQEGYYVRTVGLYAKDTQNNEFLYAVAAERTGNCYIPRYNGKTVSGLLIKLSAAVSNTDNISLKVNPAAVATVQDVEALRNAIQGAQDRMCVLASSIDETYQQATGYTDQKIADLINGAPSTLDTLGEIAQAMSENADVVEALNSAIGKKANQVEMDSHIGDGAIHVTPAEREKWNSGISAINGLNFTLITLDEYDAIPEESKDPQTLYFIMEG